MKKYIYQQLTPAQRQALCERNPILSVDLQRQVEPISHAVEQEGDRALQRFTAEFDGVKVSRFRVPDTAFLRAERAVSSTFKQSVQVAIRTIRRFHDAQLEKRVQPAIETISGVHCWRAFRPIDRVGLYIPGGSAPLFSTVLMLGIPAQIAGCRHIALCTPPNAAGEVAPEILWTAAQIGLRTCYALGGAQAIFALAYGTDQVSRVDKIFGPGNAYVTAAKALVAPRVAIDMLAGPSEVCVIADRTSHAQWVAADLLSQAEHGPESQCVLVCDCPEKIAQIHQAVRQQCATLPRKCIAEQALKTSFSLLVPDLVTAFAFSNQYAPEHLIIALRDYRAYLSQVQHAGSVFCGPYACESFGDYASGTNHTLPTSGFARACAGLGVADFGKWVTFQSVNATGMQALGPVVSHMAQQEKLAGHDRAVQMRYAHVMGGSVA